MTTDYNMATPVAGLLADTFAGPDRVQLVFTPEMGAAAAAILGSFFLLDALYGFGVFKRRRR